MRPSAVPALAPRLLAALDALAIVAFALVGMLSHRGTVSGAGVAQDAVPLLAGWFAAAAASGLYRRPARRALLATWAVGIPLGVLVRAAVLGRLDEPRQLAFLATTLAVTLAFVLATRSTASLIAGRRRGRPARRPGG